MHLDEFIPWANVRAMLTFVLPIWVVIGLPTQPNQVTNKSIDGIRDLSSRVIAEKEDSDTAHHIRKCLSDMADVIITSGKSTHTELWNNFLTW